MLEQRSAAELVALVVLVADGPSCRRRRAADAHIPVLLRIAATDAPAQGISSLDPCAVVSPQSGRPKADIPPSSHLLRCSPSNLPFTPNAGVAMLNPKHILPGMRYLLEMANGETYNRWQRGRKLGFVSRNCAQGSTGFSPTDVGKRHS